MATYHEFRELGDQWLISYACTISNMPIPTLFIAGQCLEAYCKATLLKHNPSISDIGKTYGHRIDKMIEVIQSEVGLLRDVRFLPGVESRFMTGGLIPLTDRLMADVEYLHYVPNQELYWVAKFQKEIKYLGTQTQTMPTQFAVFVMERNPYWFPIFKELRTNLVQGPGAASFSMDNFLKDTAPHLEFARQFLSSICL